MRLLCSDPDAKIEVLRRPHELGGVKSLYRRKITDPAEARRVFAFLNKCREPMVVVRIHLDRMVDIEGITSMVGAYRTRGSEKVMAVSDRRFVDLWMTAELCDADPLELVSPAVTERQNRDGRENAGRYQ